MSDHLIVPLADDCSELRRFLIETAVPPVWSLDPATACALHSEGAARTRAGWVPAVDSLPVEVVEVPRTATQVGARIYTPTEADSEPQPIIMWLHGGGWVLGNLDTTDAAARTAAVATGCTVVSIDYRCAPSHPFPAAVDDAISAVDWLLGQGRAVVVAGDSAGGNLAAHVAQARAGHPRLVGQVLVYPATDPSIDTDSYRTFVEGPFLARRDMEWFYDQYLGSTGDRTDVRVDVARGLATAATAPAVVFTVGHDPLRDEGIAYAHALRERGEKVMWIHAPELFHGSFTQSGVLPSSAARVAQVWAAAQEMFTSPV